MPRRALSSPLHPEVGNNLIGIFYNFGPSAGSSSLRKRCARLTVSIAVCVRVSAVQYAHVPLACCLCSAAYTAYRLPPITYCLLPTAYGPPSAAYCLRLPRAACRLPPAHAHEPMPRVLHTYRLLLHSACVHVPHPQE